MDTRILSQAALQHHSVAFSGLLLVSPEAEPDDPDDDGNWCDIEQMEIESEGRFVKDEGMKYAGPQRLRLTLAVTPGTRPLQFSYYFDLFGTVSLPGESG